MSEAGFEVINSVEGLVVLSREASEIFTDLQQFRLLYPSIGQLDGPISWPNNSDNFCTSDPAIVRRFFTIILLNNMNE